MFCVHCGEELKDGARFCSACGAPVDAPESDAFEQGEESASTDVVDTPASAGQTQRASVSFTQQMQSDRERSRKKLSPIAIIAIVLALLAATAFAALFITQQANQGEQAVSSAQSSASAESSSTALQEDTPQTRAIKSLDGWWQIGRVWKQDHYLYFHDGTVDVYSNDGKFQKTSLTIAPEDLVRADEGLGASHFGGPGYFIYGSDKQDYGFYLSDESPDTLAQVKSDGSGYSGGDSYTRIEPPSWAASIEGQSEGASSEVFNQEKAEAEARAAAEAAGKQVYTGTVEIVDLATRMAEIGEPNAIDLRYGENSTVAILNLDAPASATGKNPDGATSRERPTLTRDVQNILISASPNGRIDTSGAERWRRYDGQKVTIATSDMSFFSDSMGALFNVSSRDAEVISPLTEEDVKAKAQTASNAMNGDYVLSDSATRAYSRAELEAMDNHTLFLARNEVYARHGRKFVNAELQQYFGSKPWYSGTIEPNAFNEGVLNDVERANVYLMRDIEQARGSQYL